MAEGPPTPDDTKPDAALQARGMAHDVRQLLGTMMGRVQLLIEAEDDDRRRGQLRLIEAAARDAGDIVSRVIDTEASWVRGERGPIALRDCVAGVLRLADRNVTAALDHAGWNCENDVPAGCCVLAEPSALREVVMNLVVNAFEAMPDGGRLSVGATIDRGRVAIAVTDTGCGIAADLLPDVFTAGVSRGKTEGCGLGLAACRGIVRELGGEIGVESEVGRGSTFTVVLPAAEAGATPAAPAPAEIPEATRPLEILVVDDVAGIREFFLDVLGADGHRLTLVASGHEALGAFAPERYDLVCLDLRLAGLDGIETARAIRRRDADVVICLMTGWGEEVTIEGLEQGLIDLDYRKPLDLGALRRLAAEAARLRDEGRGRGATA